MLAESRQCETVADLRQRLVRWEGAPRPAFSIGLDRVLPNGFHRGTLTEYLADNGSGATALALVAAREACRDGGTLVVIERRKSFYPPAAASFCIGLNTIFVHPRTRRDELWALNQALRCQGVGAVLCWPEKLDQRAFRSLQLAAEASGTIGLLVRPISVRGHPTWSSVQLLVEALPHASTRRRLRVEIVRCRIGSVGASVEVELDDETGTLQESCDVHLAPAVAPATAVRRSPGA